MESKKYKILIADYKISCLKKLSIILEEEGFNVVFINTSSKIITSVQKSLPDIILINQSFFEETGKELQTSIQQNIHLRNIPIIVVSNKNDEMQHLQALEAGADDFIIETINPKIFLSRIKSLLRRTDVKQVKKIVQFGNYTMDTNEYIITKNDKEIKLLKREFELLAFLASNPNKVFTRKDITEALMGKDVIVGFNSIDVHICKIRQKIEPQFIETIVRIGYRFVTE